jgi:hypothetical protein
VKIVQLRLENMGTVDTKLVFRKTKCMPLMSQVNFKKWTETCGNEKDWIDMGLYPTLETSDVSNTVPKGLVALWNLMNSTRKDLVGPALFVSDVLGDMIGFGTFASVYKHKKTDHVIKLSRYGGEAALARETATLQALLKKMPTDSNIGIARFIGNDKVDINIGGVDVQLPALVMKPRGVSLEMHLANMTEGKEKDNALIKFGDQLSAALEFIHANGYYHNDVSPKNIMFGRTGTTEGAFLIDFGLASEVGKFIKGFRGTASYAHREIFQKYPYVSWQPKSKFDRTSLAFSMAALSNGGKRLWNSYQPAKLDDERREAIKLWTGKRTTAAIGRLQTVGFLEEWMKSCEDGETAEEDDDNDNDNVNVNGAYKFV